MFDLVNGGMTVSALISLLRDCAPNLPILVPGPDGGLFDLLNATVATVSLNVNSMPGTGPHDLSAKEGQCCTAVVLSFGGGGELCSPNAPRHVIET